MIHTKQRNNLRDYLKKNGIETDIHYPIPIHKQDIYKTRKKITLKNTEKQAKEILSLPIHEFLSKREVLYICKKIKKFFDEN